MRGRDWTQLCTPYFTQEVVVFLEQMATLVCARSPLPLVFSRTGYAFSRTLMRVIDRPSARYCVKQQSRQRSLDSTVPDSIKQSVRAAASAHHRSDQSTAGGVHGGRLISRVMTRLVKASAQQRRLCVVIAFCSTVRSCLCKRAWTRAPQ